MRFQSLPRNAVALCAVFLLAVTSQNSTAQYGGLFVSATPQTPILLGQPLEIAVVVRNTSSQVWEEGMEGYSWETFVDSPSWSAGWSGLLFYTTDTVDLGVTTSMIVTLGTDRLPTSPGNYSIRLTPDYNWLDVFPSVMDGSPKTLNFTISAPFTNQPPLIVRGPYLQSCTTSNIVVRWRTSKSADARVQFGLSPAALTWSLSDPSLAIDHAILLTNLAPDTRYYYAVGTGETNLASGPDYSFVTMPTRGRPTRIFALSDYGTTGTTYGIPENAAGVRDAFLAYTASHPPDVWITMGDNSQSEGLDTQYQREVFDVYPTVLRRLAMFPAIGNHDAAHYPTTFDYTNIFSPPTEGEAGGVPSHSKFYYSFDYGNIHLVSLDSLTTTARNNPAMLAWLEQDLAANTKDWTIVYWHCPPYTFGTHNSDNPADTWSAMVDMREVVLPVLEAHGVDLVLCGHSHVYERSYLLDGHYGYSSTLVPAMIKDSGSGQLGDTGAYLKAGLGPTPHQGTVYVVAAVGGWNSGVMWGLPDHHPAMIGRLEKRGFMIIDVDTNRLDARFVTENQTVADQFTIIKGAAPESLRIATHRLVNGQARLQWKTVAGCAYRVEHSPTLDNPEWTPVSGDLSATGATTGWTNTLPIGAVSGVLPSSIAGRTTLSRGSPLSLRPWSIRPSLPPPCPALLSPLRPADTSIRR